MDAEALLDAGRFDGAAYLGGYVVELALKARICQTLNWASFPQTRSEFRNYSSFKTHDLEVLLHLSGQEDSIRARHLASWSAMAAWGPETRYNPAGTTAERVARQMVEAARTLLGAL